jgi:hypothetical protein
MANFLLADDTESAPVTVELLLPAAEWRHTPSKQLSAISCKLEVRFLSQLNRFNMGR